MDITKLSQILACTLDPSLRVEAERQLNEVCLGKSSILCYENCTEHLARVKVFVFKEVIATMLFF